MLAAHATEPRYLVAGGALLVFVVGITALCTSLLILSVQLEYDKPVAAIQRAVERIRLVEYRATKWAVLGGVVIWLPALLVLFEALTGVAALARVDLLWLISNLGVGLLALAAGHALSKRYVERSDPGPRAQRIVDAMSGRSLRAIAKHLAELARFEHDEA